MSIWIPVSIIELPERNVKRSLTYPCPRSLLESRIALRKYKFIRGASPGILYELLNKNAIRGRRWDIATQDRKARDMEVEIVSFVINQYLTPIYDP